MRTQFTCILVGKIHNLSEVTVQQQVLLVLWSEGIAFVSDIEDVYKRQPTDGACLFSNYALFCFYILCFVFFCSILLLWWCCLLYTSTGDTTKTVSVAVVKYGLPSAKAFAKVL